MAYALQDQAVHVWESNFLHNLHVGTEGAPIPPTGLAGAASAAMAAT